MPTLSLQTPPEWLQKMRASSTSTWGRRPTFAVYTLGCKVNAADSLSISRMLLERGLVRVDFKAGADVYVIDTCTVTHEAARKSRKAAARAARCNPNAIVAVTGCAATLAPGEFAHELGAEFGADVFTVPNSHKMELPERVLERLRQKQRGALEWEQKYLQERAQTPIEPQLGATRERAVIKIQDGCGHACSYCIIPSVRGTSTLKPRAAIVREAKICIEEGAREIVLTGISMGDWGRDQGRRGDRGRDRGRNAAMCDLLREVCALPGIARVRTSSLDPADVDEEWLQCLASTDKLCPHIHLALQSGSAATLRRMRRRYTPARFVHWAHRWREMRPDGGLTTDVIVGFPGETEDEWRQTLDTVRAANFSQIHAFPFSPRVGTLAASLDEAVAPNVQKRRMEELAQVSGESAARFVEQFIGRTVEVLVEGSSSEERIEGFTSSYVRCSAALDAPSTWGPRVGDVARVQVLGCSDGALQGRVES